MRGEILIFSFSISSSINYFQWNTS